MYTVDSKGFCALVRVMCSVMKCMEVLHKLGRSGFFVNDLWVFCCICFALEGTRKKEDTADDKINIKQCKLYLRICFNLEASLD